MDLRERFFSLLDSLSALRALSQINLEGISEDELLSRALNELIRYQNVDSCSIYRVEDGVLNCVTGTCMTESHSVITGQVVAEGVKPSISFAPGEGIAGMALQTGQLQYCRDCAQSPDFISNPRPGADQPGSLVSSPIKMGDQVLAVLNAAHPLPEYFEPWQQHTLSLFCSSLGQMLHNHRMLHDLEFAVDQRTKELRTALHEAESLQKRYLQLSTVDELTGLNNRRYFFSEAESMLARAQRHQQVCSLMLLDVDYFKLINDQWGHLLGDKVLCAIADVIQQEARGGDLVARVGGEEFVVMLPETGLDGADLMAQRVQERLARLEFGRNVGNLGLTVSIGMTVYDHEADDQKPVNVLVDQLYSQADRAMYEGKRQGRNSRQLFTE
ncbi:MAG: sensor domain-containing diguanylate cyclase [Candidatus Thiodiazotropha sp. (ex Monitilora ramsayi)]|nr:sensor domain-containing diguanylate cyclase [Candidatus Thiodiazotropha sp. (ex Monitilora ramsayi)]